MSQKPDYYRILQVVPEADPEVVEAAYQRLASKNDPAVSTAPDAPEKMRQIDEAFAVLGNPDKRREYDASRAPWPIETEFPPGEPGAIPDEEEHAAESRQPAMAQDEVSVMAAEAMSYSDDDPHAIYAGETITRLERLWPLVWLGMLTVVCVIGIYNAVRMLP
ncbi:MAG TPA: DnaJ domain-containing protein [Dehalococcoidia bacterium]|nr:DnaJ domain-containing protein [Dehalococcoidia bacterium]